MFTPNEIISQYTRKDALDDGVLVDVTAMARAVGFQWPVAVTAAVWSCIQDIPEQRGQDPTGRLWNLLVTASQAARSHTVSECRFQVKMPQSHTNWLHVKLLAHAGDHGEPVITIMEPNED